jgi:hypothetical protein
MSTFIGNTSCLGRSRGHTGDFGHNAIWELSRTLEIHRTGILNGTEVTGERALTGVDGLLHRGVSIGNYLEEDSETSGDGRVGGNVIGKSVVIGREHDMEQRCRDAGISLAGIEGLAFQ